MARTRKLPGQNPGQNPGENPDENPETDRGPTSTAWPSDTLAPGETRADLIFAEMQPNDTMQIYRENDITKKSEFHGTLNYEQSTMNAVASLFGGGFYRLQLMRRGVKGNMIHRTMSQEIPGPYKPPTGPLPGTAAVLPPESDGPELSGMRSPGGAGMSPREMLDYAALSRLMEIMKQPAAQPASSSLASLAPILTPLIAGGFALATTLLTREKKPDEVARMVDDLRGEIKKMQDKPGPAAAGMDELLGMFEKMQNLRKAVAGGGDEQGADGGMWKDVLKMGFDMIQRGRQGAPQPEPRQLSPGEPMPAQGAPEAGGVPFPPWHQMLQEYRGMLVDAAQKNRNPAVAAGIVAEYCPDNYRGTLVELAQATNTETLLVQAVPELQHFPTWVTEFVEEVRGNLFGDSDDDGDEDDGKPEGEKK